MKTGKNTWLVQKPKVTLVPKVTNKPAPVCKPCSAKRGK